jgi:hypothetical protein
MVEVDRHAWHQAAIVRPPPAMARRRYPPVVSDEIAPGAEAPGAEAPGAEAPGAEAPGRAEPARPAGWLLGYPTDHLMGVLPSPTAADAALAELLAGGFGADTIHILVGEHAALRIDGRGTHHGPVARLYRLIQFTQMDQAPDFRRYELEARRGHPVIAVKEADPARRRTIRAILRRHGAHFTNFYARFFTETLDPYEGPDEGDLPI